MSKIRWVAHILVTFYLSSSLAFILYKSSGPAANARAKHKRVKPAARRLDSDAPLRSIWIDRHHLPYGRTGMRNLLQRMRRAGINAVFPETYSRGSSVTFASKFAPRDMRVRLPDTWLATFVEEAHRVGIQVHAWAWIFCAGTAKDPGPLLARHPSWVARGPDDEAMTTTGTSWLCPNAEAVRAHLEGVLREIASVPGLDGINFDYVRVEGRGEVHFCFCSRCKSSYLGEVLEAGHDGGPLFTARDEAFRRWRWRTVDRAVTRLSRVARRAGPGLRVSACVLPEEKVARKVCGQNWLGWLERSDVDFVCALTYDTRPAKLHTFARIYAPSLRRGLLIYPGVALHRTTPDGAKAILKAIDGSLFDGFCLFSLRQLTIEVEQHLAERYEARAVVMSRKRAAKPPGAD